MDRNQVLWAGTAGGFVGMGGVVVVRKRKSLPLVLLEKEVPKPYTPNSLFFVFPCDDFLDFLSVLVE